MKRVLHVIGKMDRAGAETMLMNIYRKIDRTQIQFDFIVFTDKLGDYDKEINELGGFIIPILESNPVKRMLVLIKFLQQHPGYEIIHCHTLFSNAFHIYAARKAGVKMRIVHSHSTSDNAKSKWISLIYHNFSRWIINKYATHYISCGDEAAKFLFPKQKNVLVLPNAVDIGFLNKIEIENNFFLNNQYALDVTCLKIIQVGRLQNVKNHFFSIKIAKELNRKKVNFKMFFIGQGELKNEIDLKIKENHLENHIILTGVRDDVPQIMAGADVMIMPSLFEGFPVVVVESQAIGLPMLISDTISQEVDLGLNLVNFESLTNDPEIWVKRLLEIKTMNRIDSQSRNSKLKEKGFDVQESAIVLLNLYKQHLFK